MTNKKHNSNLKNSSKNEKQKKKMNPVAKFLLIVIGMVTAFMLVACIGLMNYVTNNTYEAAREPEVFEDGEIAAKKKPSMADTIRSVIKPVPEKTTFLLAGIDGDGENERTDTMMIGCFYSKTKEISIVSIPRDIMVSIPREEEKLLNSVGIYPPDYMKFNEVHFWATKDYGVDALKKQIENEFGVEIDYYATISTEAFRRIIDTLGGVDMTLTRDYKYWDPDQDLNIDLKAGPQHLDGAAAEGLVRYREDYRGGDLERIEVQQNFMSELFRQVLTREKIMSNAPEIVGTLLDCVTTDLTISQATKYLQFLPALSANNINMYTVATGGGYRGPDNLAYISLDREATEEIIEQAFYGVSDTPPEDSKELKIIVLNGSGISGLAKSTSEKLTEAGYTVERIGDFIGERVPEDRVFVKKDGYGEDLKAMFPGSEIIVDKSQVETDSDITIVMGTDNSISE